MSIETSTPRGKYFEEFEVGMQVVTSGRTITESDIVNFAGLTADNNQIHVDAEYSKNGPFGQRVAHGLLCLSIASGLLVLTGVMEGTVMAFREINSWKFAKPVFIGDTIHVVAQVTETKALPRIGGGSVMLKVDLKNQNDESVIFVKQEIPTSNLSRAPPVSSL